MSEFTQKHFLMITTFLAVVFLFCGGAVFYLKDHPASNGGGVAGSAFGGAYELVDHNGQTVTDEKFAGQYKLIYFGFTFCPAICPTELQKISRVMDGLGTQANDIQPLFITIDPERDTVDVMREYVTLFHPRLIGLTGSRTQIDDVLKTYRVYARQVWEEGASDYTMDHSSYIYLMDGQDNLISIYRIADGIDYMVKDIVAKMSR